LNSQLQILRNGVFSKLLLLCVELRNSQRHTSYDAVNHSQLQILRDYVFSKVSARIILYGELSSELTLEEFGQADGGSRL